MVNKIDYKAQFTAKQLEKAPPSNPRVIASYIISRRKDTDPDTPTDTPIGTWIMEV